MKTRTRLMTLAAVGALATAGSQGAAAAADLEQAGWWTSVPVAGPTAPAGTLLIQGGPDANSPVAYAALSYTLGDGETPSALTLKVHANGGSTPGAKLELCKVSGTVGSAEGGDAASGPKPDCSTKVDGGPSADGTSYEFREGLSGFAGNGSFAVAILPVQISDRVVLDKPDASALTVTSSGSSFSSGSSGADSGFSDTSSGAGFGGGTSSGSGSGSATFDVPPAPLPSVSGGESSRGADDAAAGSEPTGGARTIANQETPGSGGGSRSPWIFAAVAAAAAALWGLAGRDTGAALADGDDEGEAAA